MKRFCYSLVSVLVLVSAFSCRKAEIESGYGYLSVALDRDDSEDLVFKSAPADDQIFSVTIYNPLGQEVANVEDYRQLASEPLVLPAGNFDYTALASSGAGKAAAFGEPFYSGTSGFRIDNGKTTEVEITCALSNVKVTADFSGIADKFSKYELTVSNSLGELVFSNVEETAGNEGYFSVTDSLFWRLDLVNTDGVPYRALADTCVNVKARQHYNFKFRLAEEDKVDGAGAVTVIVDDSMTEESKDIILDFADTTIPELSADFDCSKPLSVTAGDVTERKLTLASEDGFSSIELRYGLSNPAARAADAVYELVGATTESLAGLYADGIIVSPVTPGATSVDITLTSYIGNLAIGDYFIGLFMVDKNNAFTEKRIDLNILSEVDVEAVSADPWAKFATVHARWFPAVQPEGLSFQYRKSTDTAWTDFTGDISVDAGTRTYSAEIRGLSPETEYVFRAVTSEDIETVERSFTTESAGTVPNLGFDLWYQDGAVWYPNQDASNFYWDTANGGTKTLSIYPTTPAEPEYVYAPGEGKNAARLESKKAALVGIAAGNIYTGKFQKAVMSLTNPGAELDWGIPFTSRPLALTGYFHYLPKTVDVGNHNGMSGKQDIGQVQIMLTDWAQPFRISTASGQFVNVNEDPGIIAYGSVDLNKTQSYEQFTIELDYRDVTRTPKYIVIVAAASKYGDYFTGGIGSVLYLDEFELVYDPDELD